MPAIRKTYEPEPHDWADAPALHPDGQGYTFDELNALRLRPGRVVEWVPWRAGSRDAWDVFAHPGRAVLTATDLRGAKKILNLLEGLLIPYLDWRTRPTEWDERDFAALESPRGVAVPSVIRVPVLRRLRLRRTKDPGVWEVVAEGAVALLRSDPVPAAEVEPEDGEDCKV
ncbi:MAG: hypothetical protein AB1816_00185 [Bacillota bacterium]